MSTSTREGEGRWDATLSVLVHDRPGVLTRVAGLFSRRGYNITALSVAPTGEEGTSHMTIVVPESAPLTQVVQQLDKLIDVISVSHVPTQRQIDLTFWDRHRGLSVVPTAS